MPDLNKDTGVPHTVSLGDVLSEIELSPAHVAALLHSLAYTHAGGPNDELARTLMQHGNKVADPATYGNGPDPNNPQTRFGQPQTAQQGQSAIPASGTTNEPSWQADARAAGWTPQDADKPQPQTEMGSPPPARPGSDRARHYDVPRRVWVFNDTGEPVDMPGNIPPQPAPPPSSSPDVGYSPTYSPREYPPAGQPPA